MSRGIWPETLERSKESQRGGKVVKFLVALRYCSTEQLHKPSCAFVNKWEIHTYGSVTVSGLLMETLSSGNGECIFLTR